MISINVVYYIVTIVFLLMVYNNIYNGNSILTLYYIFLFITIPVGILSYLYKMKIIVTNKRIYGETGWWFRKFSLPIDSILEINTSSLKGIDIITSTGKTNFIKIKSISNNKEMYTEISKLLSNKQCNKQEQKPINNIKTTEKQVITNMIKKQRIVISVVAIIAIIGLIIGIRGNSQRKYDELVQKQTTVNEEQLKSNIMLNIQVTAMAKYGGNSAKVSFTQFDVSGFLVMVSGKIKGIDGAGDTYIAEFDGIYRVTDAETSKYTRDSLNITK